MHWSSRVVILLVVVFLECVLSQQTTDTEAKKKIEAANKKIETDNNCKCVLYYLCDANGFIDIYGNSVFGLRANVPIKKCNGSYEGEILCCKEKDTPATQEPTEKPPATQKPTEKGPADDINLSSCGKTKTSVIPRIHQAGEELDAIDGEFPWMVAIFDKNSRFRCGGTLIHPRVVLTANHCVYKKRPNEFTVGANGKIDLPKEDTTKRVISEIISHPRYAHTGRLFNDAALLILESPINDENITRLCLPTQNIDLEGTTCLVAGWGEDNNGERRETLKRVSLPFINHTRCDTLMKNSKLGQRFNLHSSFMCAGGEEGRDACLGDGGGALVCELSSDPQQFYQAGIVSWGTGCGLKDVPGVYTDVEKISGWIKDQLRTRNFNI